MTPATKKWTSIEDKKEIILKRYFATLAAIDKLFCAVL